MSSVKKIAIIGAGVIGATTALRLLEKCGNSVSVTIFSDEFSPNTTGDVSAGLWGPFLSSNTPEHKILEWGNPTHNFFHKLWQNGDAENAGISLLSVTRLSTDPNYPYEVVRKSAVFGSRDLDSKELEELGKKRKRNYKAGIHFITFTCEPSYFLPFLYKRISTAGGYIKRKRISSFDELHEFDFVINCAGIGAREIVKNDTKLKPIRGQVTRAHASWITEALLEDSDDGNYLIANMNTVVMGGTHQENDYNLNADANDRQFIHEGCHRLNPSVKHAEILMEKVGLRPGRTEVRLEREIFTTSNGKKLHIIHNYGHGGCGVTLSYGCAIEVANIVDNIMKMDAIVKARL